MFQRFARRSRQRKPAEQPSGKPFPISRRSCSQSLLRASQSLLLLFLQSSSCDRFGIPPTRLLVRQTFSLLSVVWPALRFLCKWKWRRLSSSARLTQTTRFGCRTVGHRNGGQTAGETHAHPSREFAVGPSSQQKGAKETKELIVLNSLILDCRLTAGALSKEASSQVWPRWLPTGRHQQISERLFCSLPKAHGHHFFHHVHVFTDGSVDFDEAQSSSPFPPSALSAGFSGVVFVACGNELLFLGAFWSPLFQQFSQCKTPSASQRLRLKLAAVAGTLKLFGNTLARHRVGLTIHADCPFAIQATKGLCSSKACSFDTDLTRKNFVLLAQHIPIDIIHVSAHQGEHR